MEKKQSQNYVAIPMRMFAFDSKYYATDDEFLVFYVLGTLVSARNPNLVHCNIEMLHSILDLDKSNTSRGKKRIKEALIGLHDKGYVAMSFSDDGLKNTTYLNIHLPQLDNRIYTEDVISGNWKFKGYTQVFDDMYSASNDNVQHLKVLIYTDWRSFSHSETPNTYSISYSEWESVLNVCHKTAVKIITECEEANLIHKDRGQYYIDSLGKPRQETNKYTVIDADERIEKAEKEKAKKPLLERQRNTAIKSAVLSMDSTEQRKHKLFESGSKLDENDYYIWITTDCPKVKEQGDKRYNALAKVDGGKKMVDDWKRKAQSRIDQERRKKEKEEYNKELMKDFSDNKRTYQYKAKKRQDDLSEILDDEFDELEDFEDDSLPFQ